MVALCKRKIVRKNIFLITLVLSFVRLSAQELDAAKVFSLSDMDQLFLEHNYGLLQQKYNIAQADAEILQAKVWSNPELSISEVNLWHNSTIEDLPPLWNGNPGKQQFAVELEQELMTAGKRKKNIRIKSLEKDIEKLDFDNLVRELKYEIRQHFAEYMRLEQKERLLRKLLTQFEALESAYTRQEAAQNIRKIDLLRIQGEAKGYKTEIAGIALEKQEKTHALSTLIGVALPPGMTLQEETQSSRLLDATPEMLKKIAVETRPDFKALKSQMQLATQNLTLQRAERIPNLNFQVNYDHGGGVMHHFVGVGLSMDVPMFNRNKGNIQSAKIGIDKAENQLDAAHFELQSELQKLWNQLHTQKEALAEWSEEYRSELDNMLEISTRNFSRQNQSLIEYLDFIGFYVDTLDEYYALTEEHKKTKETLFYIIGKEL